MTKFYGWIVLLLLTVAADAGQSDVGESHRAIHKAGGGCERNQCWVLQLSKECPGLFSVPLPRIDAAMFDDEKVYMSYFKGLDDAQLVPALVDVVDFMIHQKPKNGQRWIQSIAQAELRERADYLLKNRQAVAEQLFAIYKCTPEKMVCLASVFSNLHLKEFSQPMAVAELSRGGSRFANEYLFGESLTDSDALVLRNALWETGDWSEQRDLFIVLIRSGKMDAAFAAKVFRDRTLKQFVRCDALEFVLETGSFDVEEVKKIALDHREAAFVRGVAVKYLVMEDPLPLEVISSCLRDDAFGQSASQAVRDAAAHIQNSTSNYSAVRAKWMRSVQPLLAVLQEVAEDARFKYRAEAAKRAAETILKTEVIGR